MRITFLKQYGNHGRGARVDWQDSQEATQLIAQGIARDEWGGDDILPEVVAEDPPAEDPPAEDEKPARKRAKKEGD